MRKSKTNPITATLLAETRNAAEIVYFMYEGMILEELPFEQISWAGTIKKLPVELYLTFPNKKQLGRFLREMSQVEGLTVVCSYLDGEE